MEAVRAATAADLDRLGLLATELASLVTHQRGGPQLLADHHRPQGEDDGGQEARSWLAGALSHEDSVVLAGLLDQVVIGFAAGHVESGGDGGTRGVLDACFVETEARGVGVGRLLLDGVVRWAEDRGAGGLDGSALPGDRSAKNFYEAAGFKARLLTMHRPLR